ncbi:hypothetical protein GIB67_017322 [Kingdonia uniflora]|uniref:Uncharacterized protein n=1 Tax=Kingdonia uniflora TaxID=39325 RepID=A0A7J7N5X4_9MAGN|nr:hypothetical protein GIB67_017322 [Kingdonia uniflora]
MYKRILGVVCLCLVDYDLSHYIDLAVDDDVENHQRKKASVNEHGDRVHQSEDVAEQYDASHHEHASLSPNAHDTMPTRGGSVGFDQQASKAQGR